MGALYLEPEGRHSPRRVFRRCGYSWEWTPYGGDMSRWFGWGYNDWRPDDWVEISRTEFCEATIDA